MRTSNKPAVVTIALAAVLIAGCQSNSGTGSPAAVPKAPAAASASVTSSAAPSAAPSGTSPGTSAEQADNGVAALPAAEIVKRAKTALKQAKSFRVTGSVVDNGQRINFDLKTRGTDVGGSLAFGKAKAELLSVKGRQYIRPNQQFWAMAGDPQKAPTIAKLMAGRWVKVPAGNKDFAELFNVANVDGLLQPDGALTKGAEKTVEGTRTISLVDRGREGGTLYVATVGQPYPIRMEPAKASDGQLTFSAFGNAFPEIKAPADAQVVDLEALA